MLDSPVLVDQSMVCRSNTDRRDHFPRIQLVVSLFSGIHQVVSLLSGIHQICIPTFPFDLSTQSDTFIHTVIAIGIYYSTVIDVTSWTKH